MNAQSTMRGRLPSVHRSTAASVVLCLCLFWAVAWGPAVRANPLDAYGFGARAMGLSGAYTALADDFSANYYNPAGLAVSGKLRIELGYAFHQPALTINGVDSEVDESRGFQGGVVLGGEIGGHRIAASVGLFLPDALVSRIRSLPQQQPRWALVDNRPQRIVVTTSLAVEVVDNLFIGAGITFLANTTGTVNMTGDVALTDPNNTKLLSAVDVDLTSIRYPTFGIQYHHDDWSFGLTWREEFNLRLDIDVLVSGRILNDLGNFDPENPTILIEEGTLQLVSGNNNLFSPRQLAMGVAYRGSRWTLALDLSWVQWSRFPPPTASVQIDLDLGELPFKIPPIDAPLETKFHDIWVPRVGVEYTPLDEPDVGVTLRGGYFYEPSPAPEQTGATNYIDTDKHGFSLGMSLRLSMLKPTLTEPMFLDIAGQLLWHPDRVHRKSDPADPVGDYVAGGLTFGVSTTLKVLF